MNVKEAVYKALSEYPTWLFCNDLREPSIIVFSLRASVEDTKLEEHLEALQGGVALEEDIYATTEGNTVRIVADDGGMGSMSILISRCGVSYTYDNPNPRPNWITEEGWYTTREDICNALSQFPDWKLETYPPFAGETILRVALCAEVEALRDVLDPEHVQLLLDEETLAISVRFLHWGDLDAGRIKLTAFKGRPAMERFVEKYNIAYKEIA